jgi:hypothetical protein
VRAPRIAWATLAIAAAIVAIIWISSSRLDEEDAQTRQTAGRGAQRNAHLGAAVRDARRPPASRVSGRVPLGPVSSASSAPRRPLPPANLPLVQIRAELEARVRQGDAAAACRLGYELDRCNKLPQLRSGPEFWRGQLAKPSTPPENRQSLQWLLDKSQSAMDDAEATCAGLDPATDTTLAWDYTLAAALAGNRTAIWRASFFPAGLDAGRPENTLEGWTQWRAAAPGLIDLGLQSGDPRIFTIASRDYLLPTYGGRLFERDPVRALALILATEPAASPAYLPVVQRNAQLIIDEQKLTPGDVDAARALAATFPPVRADAGGFDWSHGMDPDATANDCERP